MPSGPPASPCRGSVSSRRACSKWTVTHRCDAPGFPPCASAAELRIVERARPLCSPALCWTPPGKPLRLLWRQPLQPGTMDRQESPPQPPHRHRRSLQRANEVSMGNFSSASRVAGKEGGGTARRTPCARRTHGLEEVEVE